MPQRSDNPPVVAKGRVIPRPYAFPESINPFVVKEDSSPAGQYQRRSLVQVDSLSMLVTPGTSICVDGSCHSCKLCQARPVNFVERRDVRLSQLSPAYSVLAC